MYFSLHRRGHYGPFASTNTLEIALDVARNVAHRTGETVEIRRDEEPRWCAIVCGCKLLPGEQGRASDRQMRMLT